VCFCVQTVMPKYMMGFWMLGFYKDKNMKKPSIMECRIAAEDFHAAQMTAVYRDVSDARSCLHPRATPSYAPPLVNCEVEFLVGYLEYLLERCPNLAELRLTKIYVNRLRRQKQHWTWWE